MAALELSNQLFDAERSVFLEAPRVPNEVGDFSNVVSGKWLRFTPTGIGEVIYKNKIYKTIPLGETFIGKNSIVALFFSKGVYYSQW